MRIDGERLRTARLRRGMSQADLSESTGIMRATISRLENDAREQTRISTVRKLAEALGLTVDELVVWGEPEQETGKAAA